MQKRRQDCAAEKRADGEVCLDRAKPFGVALYAVAVTGQGVGSLLNAGNGAADEEAGWVEDGLAGELKLLSRGERGCVPIVCDEEIGDEADETLMLFDVNLCFCQIYL